ncbi:RidA family protein [Pseudomonas sp. CFA]|nr:RidA family protein [Pseudomonas sp. CFA]
MSIGKCLSHIVVNKGTAYLTGQAPVDRNQGICGRARQVLALIGELLRSADTCEANINFAQLWLKHVVRDFLAMNSVWEEWISHESLPARATVGANLAADSILVDIALQAAID